MTVKLYKWTIKDWHELVDSGVLADKKVELLEGDIVKMSPQDIKHSATNDFVGEYLQQLLSDIAHIRRASPITLDNSEPEPDIAILRLPKQIYLKHHPYAENIYWLIEISNRTLKKDLGKKATIYASNNIAEYWVIDLKNKKVIVHTQPNDNKYQKVEKFTTGSITPVAFPDVSVELDRLLLY